MASNPVSVQQPESPADENTSLLRIGSSSDDLRKANLVHNKPASKLLVITLLLLYFVFFNFSDELILPAQTRVFEAIYCRKYYEKHDPSLIGSDRPGGNGVDERWCKGSVVQGEVAMLKGWQVTLDSIAMLIFSLPWGYFADIYGRKSVLLLASSALWIKWLYIQFICYFDGAIQLRLMWISAVYPIFGGGTSVIGAMVYTMVSDVTPEGERVTIFFQLMAASFITQFLGPLLSASLMTWNPWIPMILGLLLGILSILLISFLPETLSYEKPPLPLPTSLHHHSTTASLPTNPMKPASSWSNLLHHARASQSFLFTDLRLALMLLAFTPHMLLLNRDILLQYISTRFKISLSRATVLISTRSGLVLFLSLAVFPAANILLRKRLGPKQSDLVLSRISVALYALSFLLIGLAPNFAILVLALVINALGWGLFGFIRSLLTSLVEVHYIGRLNSFIAIFDTAGSMFGSPVLAMLFKKGVELEGWWFGLPFLICTAILAVIGVILAGVSVD